MKKYKWGIIGPGRIAETFAAGLKVLKNAELYAVASRTQQNADRFGKKFHASKMYGSYSEIVKDPDVDVIYIATPHNLHYENTLMCLQNKKPVLCEKPLAVNLKQVDEMIASAKQNQTFLMEAMWTRYLPKVEKAIQLIDDGKIGKIEYLRSDFGFNAPFNPEGRLYNPELAGGSLLDIGIYPIFFALQFMGYPDKITAHAKLSQTGVDESCSMVLEYNDGKIAQLFSTILADTPMTTDIAGSAGHLTFPKPLHAPADVFVNNRKNQKKTCKIKYEGNGYHYQAVEVMKCLEKGQLQSDKISWEFSRNMIRVMDEVREQIGLKYPFE